VASPPRQEADGGDPGALTALGGGRFELSGSVGFADASRLLAAGDAAFRDEAAAEVDLARVTRADSAGLALLLEWSLSALDAGRTIRYRNVPASLASLASLAGVDDEAALLGSSSGG
jgi:phospholipid transport system transporter-binding protein